MLWILCKNYIRLSNECIKNKKFKKIKIFFFKKKITHLDQLIQNKIFIFAFLIISVKINRLIGEIENEF